MKQRQPQVKTKCFSVSKTIEDDGGRRCIWTKKHDQLVSQKSKSVLTECADERERESSESVAAFNECLWVVQIFTVSKTREVATTAGKNECFTVSKTSEVPTTAGKTECFAVSKTSEVQKTAGKDECFTVSKTSEDDGVYGLKNTIG